VVVALVLGSMAHLGKIGALQTAAKTLVTRLSARAVETTREPNAKARP